MGPMCGRPEIRLKGKPPIPSVTSDNHVLFGRHHHNAALGQSLLSMIVLLDLIMPLNASQDEMWMDRWKARLNVLHAQGRDQWMESWGCPMVSGHPPI